MLKILKKVKKEHYVLLAILVIASITRLWKIDEYLPFLGDEGRDVRVVKRFLTDFDLMFVGPRTSIGDMYLGPLYYYYMAPWLGLFNFSPTGPAVGVAVLGIATVFLLWYAVREWFGKTAALVSALLYSLSPTTINLSKHSWNPNIMPFFALLSIFCIWRIWSKKQYKWFIVLGISLAFVVQSHYLGLLLVPTIIIFWTLSLTGNWAVSRRMEIGNFLQYTTISIVIFAGLMSPLILFDYKHGWHNTTSVAKFFTERQTTVSAKPWNAIPQTWPIWKDKIIPDLLGKTKLTEILALFLTLGVGVTIYTQRKKPLNPLFLCLTWLTIGLIGLASLKQSIFSHYYGFLFPLPFIFLGFISQKLTDTRNFKIVSLILIALVLSSELSNLPLKNPPQRQMQRVQEINKKILSESGGKPFNFGLIAKQNYEEGYLYYFELLKAQVKIANPHDTKNTITDQLFVVCEDSVCDSPIYSSKSEIAHFGWSKVDKEWEVRGVRLYKLAHFEK